MRPTNYITHFHRVAMLPTTRTMQALQPWRFAVCASFQLDGVTSRTLSTLRAAHARHAFASSQKAALAGK